MSEIKGRELDLLVAKEFFGFSQFGRYGTGSIIGLRDGRYEPVPCYSSWLDKTVLVEREIESRGLQEAYLQALISICELDAQIFSSAIECNPNTSSDGPTVLWRLVCATPEQRCQAALEVIKS